jgi:hypothetical protein
MELFKLKVSNRPYPSFKLIKLTDKYSQAYKNLEWDDVYGGKFETIFNYDESFQEIFGKRSFNAAEFLEEIPIYLVDTQMSNTEKWDGEKYIPVPSDKRMVDSGLEEFDIDKWLKSKDGEHPSTEEKSREKDTEILAIYINDGSPRIFIWVDKIIDYQWPNNSEALFAFILFHELAHAMMDVKLYDVPSAKNFTEKDVPYVFIEESFADALALKMVYDTRSKLEQDKINEFIESQGAEYSKAVIRLWKSDCSDLVSQWIAMKVLFDFDLAHLIHDFWKDKDFNKLTCFLSVGHPDWFAKKTSLNKWILTDAKSLKPVPGVR